MKAESLLGLSGKVALVTGGATGIGCSCAHMLASVGADVVIADIDEERGKEAVAGVCKEGRRGLFVLSDISKATMVRSMVEFTVAAFGRIDVAVNCAGIYRAGEDISYSESDWDSVMSVNLKGTWLCAREEMRQMASQTPHGGKIINIASIGARRAISNSAYDASKAGIVGLTRTLAVEAGRYNVTVNSVSPGYVSPVFGCERPAEDQKRLREVTPLRRVERLQDLHGPILFFASAASDYVTGQDLVVDGGHTLGTWVVPLRQGDA